MMEFFISQKKGVDCYSKVNLYTFVNDYIFEYKYFQLTIYIYIYKAFACKGVLEYVGFRAHKSWF